MQALGFCESNDPRLRCIQHARAFNSGLVMVLLYALGALSSLATTSGLGKLSIAQQKYTSAPNQESDEAKAILYFFTARWCGPCHKVQPAVEKLCRKHSSIVELAYVDFSSESELVESFQVRAIPAFVLLDLKRRLVFRAEDGRRETLEALAAAVEKLARVEEEIREPVNPPPLADPKSGRNGGFGRR